MMSVLFVTLIMFFLLNIPIALSIGSATLLTLMLGQIPPTVLVQKMFTAMDSFPLMGRQIGRASCRERV